MGQVNSDQQCIKCLFFLCGDFRLEQEKHAVCHMILVHTRQYINATHKGGTTTLHVAVHKANALCRQPYVPSVKEGDPLGPEGNPLACWPMSFDIISSRREIISW